MPKDDKPNKKDKNDTAAKGSIPTSAPGNGKWICAEEKPTGKYSDGHPPG